MRPENDPKLQPHNLSVKEGAVLINLATQRHPGQLLVRSNGERFSLLRIVQDGDGRYQYVWVEDGREVIHPINLEVWHWEHYIKQAWQLLIPKIVGVMASEKFNQFVYVWDNDWLDWRLVAFHCEELETAVGAVEDADEVEIIFYLPVEAEGEDAYWVFDTVPRLEELWR